MSTTIVIVDDEPLARQRLERLLKGMPDFSVVGHADSGLALWPLLDLHQPDTCLLDIHLPGLSGLELAQQLNMRLEPPAIIFCTAYEQHALAAFDYQAVDYLLKPVRQERLAAALARAKALRAGVTAKPEAYLLIQQGDRLIKLRWGDIRCLLAEDKYVVVISASERYLSNISLNQFEQQQPERLLRVHRNALVTRGSVNALVQTEQGAIVEVADVDQIISVSRRHIAALRRQLKDNQAILP